jgi:pectin methylesterase-like acyl-CoA thioesterase
MTLTPWLALTIGCASSPAPRAADDPDAPDAGPLDAGPSLLELVERRFPGADAKGICNDAQLRLGFSLPVVLGASGRIRVFDSLAPDVAVETIDLDAASFTDVIAGRTFQRNRPVYVDGSEAVVYLRHGALTPEHTYFVSIDAGAFVDSAGAALPGISRASDWRFTTKAPAPASPNELVVALDGSGDFCSVQGAVDSIPSGGTTPVRITLENGVYREIVLITAKSSLTLRGEDRKNTIIAYANNENLQGKLGSRFRATVSAENVSGLVIENLTLHNSTPQGGSQAEALRIDPGDQVIVRNADLKSLQDTLLLTGRVYVHDCYIEGNVDFVWGKGAAYFERCELKTVGRSGYNVQARNTTEYGYVFVDSKLTSDPGVTGNLLGRIEADRFPDSHVAYVDCQMGPHIASVGWLVTGAPAGGVPGLRFWEHGSTDLAGAPLDVSLRHSLSKQLSDAEASAMRDKATVLGGWVPGG